MTRRVIAFHYSLTVSSGEEVDSSRGGEPFAFFVGSGQIIPGLEKALMDLNTGAKQKIHVPAEEAYGVRDESLIIVIPRAKLPAETVQVGDRFRGEQGPESRIFTVMEVNEIEVTLDGNHSLAGQDLIFDVEVMEMRDATPEEEAHGHPHGKHGHEH